MNSPILVIADFAKAELYCLNEILNDTKHPLHQEYSNLLESTSNTSSILHNRNHPFHANHPNQQSLDTNKEQRIENNPPLRAPAGTSEHVVNAGSSEYTTRPSRRGCYISIGTRTGRYYAAPREPQDALRLIMLEL